MPDIRRGFILKTDSGYLSDEVGWTGEVTSIHDATLYAEDSQDRLDRLLRHNRACEENHGEQRWPGMKAVRAKKTVTYSVEVVEEP
jgi:hypothetical protein